MCGQGEYGKSLYLPLPKQYLCNNGAAKTSEEHWAEVCERTHSPEEAGFPGCLR